MRILATLALICAVMVALVSFAATAGYAQTKPTKDEGAASANTLKGDDLYRQFCAVCHGADGKGKGPAASALKVQVTDLTQLTRQNNGKFPTAHVRNILTGADAVAAHGNVAMPTWGDTFKSSAGDATSGARRIDALVEYLQKIQR